MVLRLSHAQPCAKDHLADRFFKVDVEQPHLLHCLPSLPEWCLLSCGFVSHSALPHTVALRQVAALMSDSQASVSFDFLRWQEWNIHSAPRQWIHTKLHRDRRLHRSSGGAIHLGMAFVGGPSPNRSVTSAI